MATISIPGIGTGLDVNNILEQIVDAERTPTETRLNREEATLQAELSAFGTFKGAVSTFQSSLSKLQSAALFNNSTAQVSDTDVFTASTSSITEAGNYSVEVKNLAQSHTVASIAFDDLTDVIGSGTLTFDFGTTVYDPGTDFQTGDDTYTSFTSNTDRASESIVIDNTNNTVSGIRDAINDADIGVTASIIDDGNGFRLLISSDQQGNDNSLEISVDEGGLASENIDTSGLSQLAFNSSATNVEQTQSGQDAELTINGLTVLRESNTVTGAVPGVTLNLKSADPGNIVQLSVANTDVSEAQTNISNLVTAFNELNAVFNDLTEYGGAEGQNGILLGDNTSRSIMQDIRRELGGFVNNGGTYNSLSSIGIITKRDGTLEVDSDALNTALKEDFASATQLFYSNANPSDSDITFKSSSGATQEGRYAVSISALATQGSFSGDSVAGPITIDGSNDTFSFDIDGTATGTVTLSQATYTDMDALAQEIENRINASNFIENAGINASVEYASGRFTISSSSYGTDSTVTINAENASLGFSSTGTSTAGTDVVGSIGGLPATGDGRLLTGTGNASGLQVEVAGTTIGNRGQITFSQGLATKLNSLMTDFLADDGNFDTKTDSLNEQISEIATQRADLLLRVEQIEARFRAQFSALDTLISGINATSDFLDQQLSSLPTIGSNNNR